MRTGADRPPAVGLGRGTRHHLHNAHGGYYDLGPGRAEPPDRHRSRGFPFQRQLWCRERDLNPHGGYPLDFESSASAVPPSRRAVIVARPAPYRQCRGGAQRPVPCRQGPTPSAAWWACCAVTSPLSRASAPALREDRLAMDTRRGRFIGVVELRTRKPRRPVGGHLREFVGVALLASHEGRELLGVVASCPAAALAGHRASPRRPAYPGPPRHMCHDRHPSARAHVLGLLHGHQQVVVVLLVERGARGGGLHLQRVQVCARVGEDLLQNDQRARVDGGGGDLA